MNTQGPEDGLLALPDAVLSKILRSVAAPGHPSLCVLRLTCRGFQAVVDGLVGHLQVVFKEQPSSLPDKPHSQAATKALSEALSALHLQSRYPQDFAADDTEGGPSSQPPPPPPDICLAPLRFRHTNRVTLHLPDGPTPAALNFVRNALPHLAQLVQIDCTGALNRELVKMLADACPGLQRLHLSPTSILPDSSAYTGHGSSSSSSNSNSSSGSRSSSNSRSSHTSTEVRDPPQLAQGQSMASALRSLPAHRSSQDREGYPADSSDDSDSASAGMDADSHSNDDHSDCSELDTHHAPLSDVPGAVPGNHGHTGLVSEMQARQHVAGSSRSSTNAEAPQASLSSGASTSPHSHTTLPRTPNQSVQAAQLLPPRHQHQHTSSTIPTPTVTQASRAARRRRTSSTFFLHASDLRAFVHLRQLRLEPTEPRVLESFGSVEIAALRKLPSLQSLVVLCPLWQMLPQLRDVSLLRGCTGLRHLQMGRIDTSSVGFRLPSLCHLSSLHVLQLGIGGMVDGVAETIGSGLPMLRCLQLTTTRPLGQSGWQALGSLTGLRTLDLAAPAERVVPLLQPPEPLLPGSFAALRSLKLQLLRWFGKASQGLEMRSDVLSTLLPIPSLRVLLLAEGFAADDHLATNLAPHLQDASPMRLEVLMVQGVARLSWRGLCGMLESTGATHVQLGLSSQLLEDNRYPGLLEDRRVLQPGSSLQLKRSSLSLELRISYSSGCSNSSSMPIRNPSKTMPHQLNRRVHHGHVVGNSGVPRHGAVAAASETPSCSSSLRGVSRNVDGLMPQVCDSAAGCGDAVLGHLAGVAVPWVKSTQTRAVRGGVQAEGVLLVQACSSGVPVHRCDS